ncbi:MAG: 7-cyano-7-deazaguanine synthase QueC [Intestinibacter sp.]
MGKKAVVLNSGGVDSTTCVGLAVEKYGKDNVSTLSVFYGQKHNKELECAKKIAAHYEVAHYEVDLSAVMQFSNCPLLSQSTEAIRHESYAEQIAKDGEGMVRTYVPFRNGLLLSSVTALAVSLYPDDEVEVYYGAHADDAAGRAYADCSPEFADAMNRAINIGTYEKVTLTAPLINMNKGEVVKTGLAINVPYELTWSCYEGGEKACGTCGTCIDRINAFKANNTEDPIDYIDNSVKSL